MSFQIRSFLLSDYDEAYQLWARCEGIGLSSADSLEAISAFLDRNPGLSRVAISQSRLVGAVLCGQDGRRGYIHHLAVDQAYRKQGIGRALAESCLQALHENGIQKCHIFVYQDNEPGKDFWKNGNWISRDELLVFSKDTN